MTYSLTIHVYFEDTDAAGVVYYGNYLKFMERARSQWFADHGLGMKTLMDRHRLVFVVSRTELNYHRSAKLEDKLRVTVELESLKKVSAVFRQRVYRGEDELLCTGVTRVGCVNLDTLKPAAMPAEIIRDLQQLGDQQA